MHQKKYTSLFLDVVVVHLLFKEKKERREKETHLNIHQQENE